MTGTFELVPIKDIMKKEKKREKQPGISLSTFINPNIHILFSVKYFLVMKFLNLSMRLTFGTPSPIEPWLVLSLLSLFLTTITRYYLEFD